MNENTIVKSETIPYESGRDPRKLEINKNSRKINAVCETQAPLGAGKRTVYFEDYYIVSDENKTNIKYRNGA